ncbi:MAG: isopentenyl-diphosphate Delta-isomerase [Bacteroidota bacterium]|jgi:isopentenyl-diphosphate Delta-isomerase|nr:isopentenyl-diphosphate Delta-isomerase [Bacteroidota bacterium]
MNELLILVDENDIETGWLDKLTVHQTGALHRAFSVFIFNSKNELLLQQRADEKYHSAGLWSNTCCSHPGRGEKVSDAVNRRLKEEMGIQCDTIFEFSFIYKMEFENGLTEHEFDHVFFGKSDDIPNPDSREVKSWKYISLEKLEEEMMICPGQYSAWLKICLPKVMEHFNQIK